MSWNFPDSLKHSIAAQKNNSGRDFIISYLKIYVIMNIQRTKSNSKVIKR